MDAIILCYLFLLHFIADFLLQSREMGKAKSEDLKVLFQHVAIHFSIFFILGQVFLDFKTALAFSLANAIIHGFIDWHIWILYKWSVYLRNKKVPLDKLKKEWKFQEDHWFYVTIGLDQLLHTCTIILKYYLLT